jgi:hypothetical protein
MAIPAQQARSIFTNVLIARFKESNLIKVPQFLRSFFPTVVNSSKMVSIEVQRGTELMAADVLRGVDGNRNQFTRSTEKNFIPPFYNENFDITQMDRYDVVFGDDNVSGDTIGNLASEAAEKYMTLKDKIERAKEYQCAQVFETGVVTMNNGDNVDFKRKAGSIVDLGAAGYWDNTTAEVENQLVAGATFIRTYGKNGSSVFNFVMSGSAFIKLKKTGYFEKLANYQNVQLLDIRMPQKDSFGAGYHGTITAGAYIFNIWTYDETYVNSSGVVTRYWPEDYAFIVPVQGTRFVMSHAGIPQIMRKPQNAEMPEYIKYMATEYGFNNYIDPKGTAHIFEIMSAPLALPVTVDMIYTMKVLGAGGEAG